MTPRVDETRFRGEPALRLRVGSASATFLPGLGMTGVSLTHASGEFLALPGGLDALRRGSTGGLPILAPWSNRLSSPRYRVGRVDVDLTPALAAGRLHVDDNGLPIHGLLAGRSRWSVVGTGVRRGVPWLRCWIDVDAPAFPFPHRLDVEARLRDAQGEAKLEVVTTLTPTGRRAVPVGFGWHPYLRVPGTPRSRWRLRVPAMTHLALDERGIPTGAVTSEKHADAPIGRRRFDDLYALAPAARGAGRRLAFIGEDGRSVALECDESYPNAQVWVPAGHNFAALEPMTAPTNALVTGAAPRVAPGDAFDATFALKLTTTGGVG